MMATCRTNAAEIAAVKDRVRLSDLIGGTVELRPRGSEFVALCPFHDENTASFTVRDDVGRYHCFGCGADGDHLDWLEHTKGLSFRDALDFLAEYDGAPRATERPAQSRPTARRARRHELTADQKAKICRAADRWNRAAPIGGTVGETYLVQARGLPPPYPPTVRFLPACWHPAANAPMPCVIAAIQAPGGALTAVHQVFLAPDGLGKAHVDPSKLTLGPQQGGCIRLGPVAPRIILAGGLEDGLTLCLYQREPIWVRLGEAFGGFVPPAGIEHVILARDNDEPGLKHAQRGVHGLRKRGLRVAVMSPPADFKDFNAAHMERTGNG